MEAKPICVVYLPESVLNSGIRTNWDLCRDLTDQWEKEKPDYYWFAIPDYDAERIEFKVFYAKDFEKTTYQKLKELITESLKNKTDGKIKIN